MPHKKIERISELAPKIMGAFHDMGSVHPKGEKLSMRQYQALIIVKTSEQLTVSQFCSKLNLAPSTGTELINRMIDLKYIKKEGEHKDKRQVTLSVTNKGEKLLLQRKQAMTEMFKNFMQPFSVEDKDLFVQSFENIWNLIAKYYKQSHRETIEK